MGNYDRDLHLRMQAPSHRLSGGQMNQQQQVSQTSHLPHRVKSGISSTGGANLNTVPYFHHILDRNSSGNSSTNSLLYNPSYNYGEAPATTAAASKRPRVSNNFSFLAPYGAVGFPSPTFETEHSLPDFTTNWGFNSRNLTRSATSAISAAATSSNVMTTSSLSSSSANSSSNLATVGSGLTSPNGTSMFTVDSLLPDYESGLYSLWNSANGNSVMGYEPESETTPSQLQVQQHPLYMNSEEELKMDYPQLSEFNQGDLDYLCGPMESGGPSPTTPLGTSAGNSMMKMDHLVTTDRKTNAGAAGVLGRESQLERLLAPATPDYGANHGRSTTDDDAAGHKTKRACKSYGDAYGTVAYGTVPTGSDSAAGDHAISSAGALRNLAVGTTMESKRESMPPLGNFHSGSTALLSVNSSSSQSVVASSGTTPAMTVTIAAPTTTPKKKTAVKRPRSRQCDFPGCLNRARSHQKCKKHGGAHQCVFEGCTKNSQSRGLCIAHGGGSRCKVEGCVRAAQSKGLCKSHGGGEFCAVEGCRKKAHLKHLCRTHGGGVRCKVDKCTKWAQRKGWCMAHAKEYVGT